MLRTSNTMTMPIKTMQAMLKKHGGPTIKFFQATKRWFRARGFVYPKPPSSDSESQDLVVWLDREGWHHDVTE